MHISPRTWLRLAGTIAASAMLALATFATSANASARPTAGHAYKYCLVKIMPVQPHQRFSRVVSRFCSNQKAAGSSYLPLGTPQGSTAPNAIITLYQYQYWTGAFITFEGAVPGGCSDAQYAIEDSRPSAEGYGAWNAESWMAHNSCWYTTIYYNIEFGKPAYTYSQGVWEAGQIGSPWNNHVYSIWTSYNAASR
jgi:hypothetical protein